MFQHAFEEAGAVVLRPVQSLSAQPRVRRIEYPQLQYQSKGCVIRLRALTARPFVFEAREAFC